MGPFAYILAPETAQIHCGGSGLALFRRPQIWVSGPFKVEIARGNIDGSQRAVQVGVDCYFDKNSPEASGPIQVDW
jgi:hypothetical protein